MKHDHCGFTLVEILLSITIFAMMVGSIAVFAHLMIVSETKQTVMNEVEQEGMFLMSLITQTIRNADTIITPSRGTTASSITLDMYTVPDDPTVFDVVNGVVRIQKGSGEPVALTSSRVIVSHIEFYNVSPSAAPGAVRVELTLEYKNSDHRPEYEYSKIFYATAALR